MLAVASRAGAAEPWALGPADLKVESSDGVHVIGQGHYGLTRSGDSLIVTGVTKLGDGQSDAEIARLELRSADNPPVMRSYSHTFYNPDGSKMLSVDADFGSGSASCVRYLPTGPDQRVAHLDFSGDTYAGVSMVLPLTYALRAGQQKNIRFHAFSCVPEPKVVEVDANLSATDISWPGRADRLAQVEVKPYFGWLGVLASPFLPKFYAWFDPGRDWEYVGGINTRYYKGPAVRLVRSDTAPQNAVQRTRVAEPSVRNQSSKH